MMATTPSPALSACLLRCYPQAQCQAVRPPFHTDGRNTSQGSPVPGTVRDRAGLKLAPTERTGARWFWLWTLEPGGLSSDLDSALKAVWLSPSYSASLSLHLLICNGVQYRCPSVVRTEWANCVKLLKQRASQALADTEVYEGYGFWLPPESPPLSSTSLPDCGSPRVRPWSSLWPSGSRKQIALG